MGERARAAAVARVRGQHERQGGELLPGLVRLLGLGCSSGGGCQHERKLKLVMSSPAAAHPPTCLKVWSLVNLAYANHEIISDYATVAFVWFETG